MHVFEFVLAIIGLSLLYKLVDVWVRNKSLRRDDDKTNAELHRRLEQMEERVRVLERIVTAERFDLRQQFKDLGN